MASTRGTGAEPPPAPALSPRGDSRSTAEHRTDYEEADGPAEIQWQLGIASDTHRLGTQRGPGVSPAVFGDFCAYKSHPGFGAG